MGSRTSSAQYVIGVLLMCAEALQSQRISVVPSCILFTRTGSALKIASGLSKGLTIVLKVNKLDCEREEG